MWRTVRAVPRPGRRAKPELRERRLVRERSRALWRGPADCREESPDRHQVRLHRYPEGAGLVHKRRRGFLLVRREETRVFHSGSQIVNTIYNN